MNELVMQNNTIASLTVIIEPWAHCYCLQKLDTIKLLQNKELNGWYQLSFSKDAIQVHVEGDYKFPDIFLNGVEQIKPQYA